MIPNTLFHWLTINARGRDFVVGDIHGHAALLDCLLDCVRFDPASDRLFALGDLIDRGPQSELLLARVRDEPWFYSLRGNHEAMLNDALGDWYSARIWLRNGGDWAQDLPEDELQHWGDVVSGLPIAMSLPLADGRMVGLVHAELDVGHTWGELEQLASPNKDVAVDDAAGNLQAAALWGRTRIRAWATAATLDVFSAATPSRLSEIKAALRPVDGIDLIIAGHTVLADFLPVAVSNLLFIETGAYVPSGRLTLVEPLTGRFWQSRYLRSGSVRCLRRDGQLLPAPTLLPPVITQG